MRRSAAARGDLLQDLGPAWGQTVTPDGRWLVYATAGANDRTVRMRVPVAGGQPVLDATLPSGPVEWGPDDTSWLAHGYVYFGDPYTVRGRFGTSATTTVPLSPSLDDWEHTMGWVGWTGGRVSIGITPTTTAPDVRVPFSTAALAAGTTTTCSVDDGPEKRCTSPFAARLVDGTHLVRVTATEPDGRVSVGAGDEQERTADGLAAQLSLRRGG